MRLPLIWMLGDALMGSEKAQEGPSYDADSVIGVFGNGLVSVQCAVICLY